MAKSKRALKDTTSTPTPPTFTTCETRKAVALEMLNGITLYVGRLDPSVHTLKPTVSWQHPIFGVLHAELKEVKPRLAWYRQVKDAPANTTT